MKQIGLYTDKRAFIDGIEAFKAKQLIYSVCEVEEMIEELQKFNISLSKEKIIDDYEKLYNLDELLNLYYDNYIDEFDALGEKMYLLDEDVLFFMFTKIIEEKYDLETLPDPSFITKTALMIPELEEEEKADMLIKMLHAMNGLKEHGKHEYLNDYFDDISDPEDMIADCTCMRISKDSVTKKQANKLAEELIELTNNYKLYDEQFLYSLAIEFQGLYGYKNIEKTFGEALERFPNSKIRTYFDAITSLPENSKERKKLIEKIYEITPLTDEDFIYMNDLSDWLDD